MALCQSKLFAKVVQVDGFITSFQHFLYKQRIRRKNYVVRFDGFQQGAVGDIQPFKFWTRGSDLGGNGVFPDAACS